MSGTDRPSADPTEQVQKVSGVDKANQTFPIQPEDAAAPCGPVSMAAFAFESIVRFTVERAVYRCCHNSARSTIVRDSQAQPRSEFSREVGPQGRRAFHP